MAESVDFSSNGHEQLPVVEVRRVSQPNLRNVKQEEQSTLRSHNLAANMNQSGSMSGILKKDTSQGVIRTSSAISGSRQNQGQL